MLHLIRHLWVTVVLLTLIASDIPSATAQEGEAPALVATESDEITVSPATIDEDAVAGEQAIALASGAAGIPTQGLIGHWPLDGNASDTSGHGNNGTIVGATPTTGVRGGAYAFDGTAHIDLPNFAFPNSTYTVSIWFETTQPIIPDDDRVMFSQLDVPAGSGPFELMLGVDGTGLNEGPISQAWEGGNGVWSLNLPQLNPRDGRWHMLTGTYRSGQQQIFVDGALMKSMQFSGVLPSVSSGAFIGGQNFGVHQPWVGRLDEAVIYDRVLSNTEVLGLFKAAAPDASPPVTTASLSPQQNAAGWNRNDVVVTLRAVDDPGGTGVKQVTFSAAGAQPIPRTTVPGNTAIVPPITAEGLTTLTFFATDQAGNAEAAKHLVIKLDKTSPEAVIRFDPARQDLVVVGRDALSGVPAGAVVPVSVLPVAASAAEEVDAQEPTVLTQGPTHTVLRTYRVVDAAGNALQLTVSVQTGAHQLRAQIASLQYNGAAAVTPPRNSARFQWTLTSEGHLKELQQVLEVEDADAKQVVQARFEAQSNLARVPVSLVLLELRTDRGALLMTP